METKKLSKLAGIPEKTLTTSEFDKFLSDVQHPRKSEITRWRKRLMENRNKQDFFLNDIVRYCGKSTVYTGYYYQGKIIEVVKACHYPHSLVRVRGYYKDYITYVVMLNSNTRGENGELRWCSKSRLILLERKIKGIN